MLAAAAVECTQRDVASHRAMLRFAWNRSWLWGRREGSEAEIRSRTGRYRVSSMLMCCGARSGE